MQHFLGNNNIINSSASRDEGCLEGEIICSRKGLICWTDFSNKFIDHIA